MVLYTKMNKIIDEVNGEVSEREELVECIAIALLAGKNLFILGDTGQAKSYAINEFRKRIVGAKQFERLMSKQTDEEQLFGRLDLSSLIPGNMPKDELMKETSYTKLKAELDMAYEKYQLDGDEDALKTAADISQKMDYLKRIICTLKSGKPKMITEGKIPDSHIVFLDEIFKSNDGILNSLLTALNERVYTNEGETVNIPVVSFFSASNEIPNFADSTQIILKPLYDRFELKVLTEYVKEKESRMSVLKQKQLHNSRCVNSSISLDELLKMQSEVKTVHVPDTVNELMDDVLCTLRRSGIHVSDRKYFGFTPIVQAKAYLNGNSEVSPADLLILKNYFWNNPAEIPTVGKILEDLCENPLGTEVEKYLDMAREAKVVMDGRMAELEDEQGKETEKIKPYVVFSKELFRIYLGLSNLKSADLSDSDVKLIDDGATELEKMLSEAANTAGAAYISLSEQKRLEI